jgi:hypothetical protein
MSILRNGSTFFSHEVEKTATGKVVEAEEEEVDNICFANLWEQVESLEERVKVQGMHIQQVKLEMDVEDMKGHGDLLMCRKFLQLRRLHEQNQPLEQLDKVIMEIMQLMLKSTEITSEEKLRRRKKVAAAVAEWSRWEPPKIYLGSKRTSKQLQGKLMSRSS